VRRGWIAAALGAALTASLALTACGDSAEIEQTAMLPGSPLAEATATVPPTTTATPSAAPTQAADVATPPGLTSPPTPRSILQLGMADRPGGAAALAAEGIATIRYQYLSGGMTTGAGWTTWTPNGSFVRDYIEESTAAGILPVLTYYMLVQSGSDDTPESERPLDVLQDADLVGQYFDDLALFFDHASDSRAPEVILHLEPDLWGFAQQDSDDASGISVALEGARGLIGDDLPPNLAGFAQAVLRLRDERAPNVAVAYHMSFWGSGKDPILSNASLDEVDSLAARSVEFYESLGAPFDLTFTELGDRDSAFRQAIYGQGDNAWWTENDFIRHARYVQQFASATGQNIVLWQIPYGNTRMRAMNNTWNHFQDNKVEWLLDDETGKHLRTYVDAGVVALLFGRGVDGATDASDANGDGVTNPEPINGNETPSLSADDDGGFFRDRAAHYYRSGGVPLR